MRYQGRLRPWRFRSTREKGRPPWFKCAPSVAAQHAIYQTADIRDAKTRAAVAMVAIASVIDRSAAPVVAASVSRAVTATSISASGASGRCMSVHGMSAYCLSAAATVAGVVGSKNRIRLTTSAAASDSNYGVVKSSSPIGSSRIAWWLLIVAGHVGTCSRVRPQRASTCLSGGGGEFYPHRSPAALVRTRAVNGTFGYSC